MTQHFVYLNKQTTDFVISKSKPGESVSVAAARLLRDMASRGTPEIDTDYEAYLEREFEKGH